MPHLYAEQEIAFLVSHIKGRTYIELTALFNEHFGVHLAVGQIKAACKNRKLTNGLNGQFVSGRTAHNKGKKGVGGWPPTQFRKGHRPHNWQPVGSERVNGDGYVDVKIAEPNKWRGKHLLLWEERHGQLPKGFAVIFADGNRRNFAQENLVKVSRRELAYLNRNRLLQGNAGLTAVAITIANVAQKAAMLVRKHGGGSVKACRAGEGA